MFLKTANDEDSHGKKKKKTKEKGNYASFKLNALFSSVVKRDIETLRVA